MDEVENYGLEDRGEVADDMDDATQNFCESMWGGGPIPGASSHCFTAGFGYIYNWGWGQVYKDEAQRQQAALISAYDQTEKNLYGFKEAYEKVMSSVNKAIGDKYSDVYQNMLGKNTRITAGIMYPNGGYHKQMNPYLGASYDQSGKKGDIVYSTNIAKIDVNKSDINGLGPLGWFNGKEGFSFNEYGHWVQGEGFGYCFIAEWLDDGFSNITYMIEAHLDPNSPYSIAINELVSLAREEGITSFTLPAGTPIGQLGMTGCWDGWHGHWEHFWY